MDLLGTRWEVVGLVSWFWFLEGVVVGSGFGLVFLGLVLEVLAKPVCVSRTNVDSTLMNTFWFLSGWGFGFILWFGLGLVSWVWFSGSGFILGVLGNCGLSKWFFSGLLFLFGVIGWVCRV